MASLKVEVANASPEILEEAAQASVEAFSRRKNRVRKWVSEIAYGCATCAPAGVAVHLLTCVGLPLLASSTLSSALNVEKGNLAEKILYALPNSELTRSVAGPLLSADISDTALKTGLTALFNVAAFGILYAVRLKHKTSSIQVLNGGFFAAGLAISTAFNLGNFVQNREVYQQWLANSPPHTQQIYTEAQQSMQWNFNRPYANNPYLYWLGSQENSCIPQRKPNQSTASYIVASAKAVTGTIATGFTSPFNGRFSHALEPSRNNAALNGRIDTHAQRNSL